VYVVAPGKHMLVTNDRIVLSTAPKENFSVSVPLR